MAYTQDGRRLVVKTPLGKDKLILSGFSGREAISRPFFFQLECVAENATTIPFDGLLGKRVTAEIDLPGCSKRWINGICNRVAQGARDATRYGPLLGGFSLRAATGQTFGDYTELVYHDAYLHNKGELEQKVGGRYSKDGRLLAVACEESLSIFER